MSNLSPRVTAVQVVRENMCGNLAPDNAAQYCSPGQPNISSSSSTRLLSAVCTCEIIGKISLKASHRRPPGPRNMAVLRAFSLWYPHSSCGVLRGLPSSGAASSSSSSVSRMTHTCLSQAAQFFFSVKASSP